MNPDDLGWILPAPEGRPRGYTRGRAALPRRVGRAHSHAHSHALGDHAFHTSGMALCELGCISCACSRVCVGEDSMANGQLIAMSRRGVNLSLPERMLHFPERTSDWFRRTLRVAALRSRAGYQDVKFTLQRCNQQ